MSLLTHCGRSLLLLNTDVMIRDEESLILSVRRESENFFEYYIQQGRKKIHFLITRDSHEELKRAQAMAEVCLPLAAQIQERPVIGLEIVPPGKSQGPLPSDTVLPKN